MLARVLVANRGEIARRIMRTCRRLGIQTVAVYSDADVDEPHVREADVAVRLGPAPAVESYLDVDRVVEAARASGCDAVHPGYGFLAERASFARAVREAGLTFVGPSAEVIELMGDKAAAKRRLADAGVPVVPGEDRDDLDDAALITAAAGIGWPLLVKAVAGGGGKGMREVANAGELPHALAAARREAAAAFGDDRVILERLVTRARHVEMQVFGDRHGHVVHLLERECSVQRRHQKVVEEAPSPAVDARLRQRMGDAAVAAATAVGYEGAGTVEFLLDATTLERDDPDFFFLEMNTRLQVEHPVTELITGLDLVELQLRVAAGEPLDFVQDDVRADGHAIEVRVYAEDPVSHLPQTGRVLRVRFPSGPDVRTDSGIEDGSEVSRFYDPMLAKVIAHGPDRDAAVERLRLGLADDTTVHGVTTNVDLLAAVLDHPAFVAGELTTSFLDDHLAGWRPHAAPVSDAMMIAAALAVEDASGRPAPVGDPHRPWNTLGAFRPGVGRSGRPNGWRVTLVEPTRGGSTAPGSTATDVVVSQRGDVRTVWIGSGTQIGVRVVRPRDTDGAVLLELDGSPVAARTTVVTDDHATSVWVHAEGMTRHLEVVPATRSAGAGELAAVGAFTSPMPGAVLAVEVTAGQHLAAGATMVVVEAMKMEHPVVAPAAGTVTAVHVAVGDAVDGGATLLDFEPDAVDGGATLLDVEPDPVDGGATLLDVEPDPVDATDER